MLRRPWTTGSATDVRSPRPHDALVRLTVYSSTPTDLHGVAALLHTALPLARLEGRIALRETLARIPTWEIDEDRIEWVHTSTVRGFAKVPISF